MNRLSSEVVRREALVVCACDSSLSFSFCFSFSLSFSNITLPLSPSSTLKVLPSPFNPWSFFELWLLPATPVSPLVLFDVSLGVSTLPSDWEWLVISAKLVITSSYSITPDLQICHGYWGEQRWKNLLNILFTWFFETRVFTLNELL